MRKLDAPDTIDTWRIVCATQSNPCYEESRQILLYGGERDAYHGDGPFIVLDGYHCSCYDWEDVEWDAMEYTLDELLALASSKVDGRGCYDESERRFWLCVLMAVESDGWL